MHANTFNSRSEGYAAARPRYPRELYGRLASLCSRRDTAWDCGCGTGQAAVGLARYFRLVQATDSSVSQIANAEPHDRIVYSVRGSESAGFPDDFFDLVCAAQCLHWFDLDRFWPEARRVMKAGGVFAAWGYSWFRVNGGIDAAVKSALLDVIAPFWSPRNSLLWDGYENIGFPFDRLEMPPVAMVLSWDLQELMAYIGTWSAVKLCLENRGEAFFVSAAGEIGKAWGDPGRKKEVVMDFHLVAGRKD
jgi:SAM-dependent methyltransferase